MLENGYFDLNPAIALHKVSPDCYRAYDIENGDVFEINETAYRILTLIQEGRCIRDIVETMKSEFAAEAVEIEADVKDFLSQAIGERIIKQRGC